METQFIRQQQLTPNVVTFYFARPDNYSYRAGQFMELHVPHKADSRGAKRWFSLSSAPSEGELAITTRIPSEPSSFKQALLRLQPGDFVQIQHPLGDFVLPRHSRPLLFVAHGLGVTPFRSMAVELKNNKQRREITTLYAVHSSADAIFAHELENVSSLKTQTTPLTADHIIKAAQGLQQPQIYLAGAEEVVVDLYSNLAKTFDQRQLLCDSFHNFTGS